MTGLPSTFERDSTLVTADMLAQHAYCPRRMHLMYVDGRWDDNLFTEQGRSAHARTDNEEAPLPAAAEGEGDPEPVIARSVMLSDEALGLVAKPDIIEAEGTNATPVEIKRGRVPDIPLQSYEPERVQLMAQALLLRAHGFSCTEGFLYFAASRRRVRVRGGARADRARCAPRRAGCARARRRAARSRNRGAVRDGGDGAVDPDALRDGSGRRP